MWYSFGGGAGGGGSDGGEQRGTKYWEVISQLGPRTQIRPKGPYWFRSATGLLVYLNLLEPELSVPKVKPEVKKWTDEAIAMILVKYPLFDPLSIPSSFWKYFHHNHHHQ